jgi:hypothetical protein
MFAHRYSKKVVFASHKERRNIRQTREMLKDGIEFPSDGGVLLGECSLKDRQECLSYNWKKTDRNVCPTAGVLSAPG